MTKDNVTIIEIGTSKITGVVASRGVNGTFNIITKQVVDYEGYYEGEFVVQDRLGLAFDVLFSQIRMRSGMTRSPTGLRLVPRIWKFLISCPILKTVS